jgi:signal transduction histidine kinase
MGQLPGGPLVSDTEQVSSTGEPIEEPWAWVLGLRGWVDRRPRLTDAAVAVGFDAITVVPLLGHGHPWWLWLVDQALVLPLALRRRFPFLVLLFLSAVAFCQWLTDVRVPADFALFIALYTVATHESRARAIAGALILEIGAVLSAQRFPADGNVVHTFIFVSGLVVASVFVGVTFRTRRAYLDQVVRNARQLEIDRAQELQLASGQERTRIAREMHDIVAHSLSVIIALADGSSLSIRRDPGQAEEAMTTVAQVGRQSLHEMRRLLGVLREDGSPVDRLPQPSLARLDELIGRLRLVGTAVEVSVSGEPQAIPPTQDATAFRIVQESLTNVVKHAVGATQVSVLVDWTPHQLSMLIRDNGAAPTSSGPRVQGHGIDGMAERALLYDGEVTAGPLADGGWQVRAVLPLTSIG